MNSDEVALLERYRNGEEPALRALISYLQLVVLSKLMIAETSE